MASPDELLRKIAELEGQKQVIAQQHDALALAHGNAAVLMAELQSKNQALETAHQELHRNSQAQAVLNQLLSLPLRERSYEGLLTQALEILVSVEWFLCQGRGAIFLSDARRPEELVLKAQVGLDPDRLRRCGRVAEDRCVCRRAALNRDILFAPVCDHWRAAGRAEERPGGHYCVPIISGDHLYGVMLLYTAADHRSTADEVSFLSAVVAVIAGIIRIKQDEEELSQTNQDLQKNRQLLETMLLDLQTVHQQLQETQSQLIQTEKLVAVGQLSAGVAHEIKNPLAIILLGAEFLQGTMAGRDEDSKKYLQMIVDSAERANAVVTELLKFSRSAGLNLAEVAVHPVLEKAVLWSEEKAHGKEIRFVKEFGPGPAVIVSDALFLEQLFLSVLANAVDAIARQGRIVVRTAWDAAADGLRVEVEDSGVGMSAEVARRIFDPFFTTKDPGQAAGLGLSTVCNILKRHGGAIAVQSGEGVGTIIRVFLPARPPEAGEDPSGD